MFVFGDKVEMPVLFYDDPDLRYLMGYFEEPLIPDFPENLPKVKVIQKQEEKFEIEVNDEGAYFPKEGINEYEPYGPSPTPARTYRNISILERKKRRRFQNVKQNICCVKDCENYCSNRLKFSMDKNLKKMNSSIEYKVDFVTNGNNRICNNHYFSVLYKFKKHLKDSK